MNRGVVSESSTSSPTSPKFRKGTIFNHQDKSEESFKINANKAAIGQRPRSAGFRSFLRWFKKVENLHHESEDSAGSQSDSSAEDSSSSSTATVASFAFLPPNKYKPYGDASQPQKYFSPGPYTETYNKLIQERNRRRHLDKNISLRKKYSLYSSGTITNKVDKNENADNKEDVSYDTFSLPSYGHSNMNDCNEFKDNRKTASLSNRTVKRSHVKGKRKAPLPPINPEYIKSYRKKRKAPPPPLVMPPSNNIVQDNNNPSPKSPLKERKCKKTQSQLHSPNADTPSPNPEISPKPWYKRESKTKSKNSPQEVAKKKKHEFPEVGFFRCSQLFENLKSINLDRSENEGKNEKRTSRMLANISELDREAAEIIKHHKSTAENGENIFWKVNATNNQSSARELISKFNAMSNAQNNPKTNDIVEIKLSNNNIIRKDAQNAAKNVKGKSDPNNVCKNSKDLPSEGEISKSFKAEIFSALPDLAPKDNKEHDERIQSKLQTQKKLDEIEEKLKLREMLKEMKNSLPKRPKPEQAKVDDLIPNNARSSPKLALRKAPEPVQRLSIIKEAHRCEESAKSPMTKSSDSPDKNNDVVKPNTPPVDAAAPKITDIIKTHNISNINNGPSTSKVSSFAQTKSVLCKSEGVYSSEKTSEDIKPINANGLYANTGENKLSIADNSANTTSILLKRLEQAITEGNDIEAAKLAKDLAMLKANCIVMCSPQTKEIVWKKVNIYIEDQFSHQGPLPLQIPLNTNMKELKEKVSKEFNIPIAAQRWIIGKQLADNDNTLLSQYNKNDFQIPLFLYVVTLEKPAASPKVNALNENKNAPFCSKNEKIETKSENAPAKPAEPIKLPKENIESDQKPSASNNNKEMKDVAKNTWICSECTLINSLLSPLCSACGTRKPQNAEKYRENKLILNQQDNNAKIKEEQEDKNDKDVNHYMQLLNLDNRDLILNNESFDCPICFVNYAPQTGVVLRECLHTFCKECLENTIKHSDEAEMKCPYRDENYSCESVIQDREIRALVGKTMFENHLAKSIKFAENKMKNAFHCKTPDCKGWCVYDDNVNVFNCPVCKRHNCLTCQAIHEGKNCREYQNQIRSASNSSSNEGQQTKDMLDEMVKKGEALACPSCQVILMKKWGCDWVRCSMCKTEICWVTRGPRWGPSGKGDLTAGCQCGVNGIKCHPKCNYCH